MVRLIDADALVVEVFWTWQAGEDIEAVRKAILDAAPTIECEACEHLDSESDDTWVCSCPDSPTDGMEIPDPSVEASRYFERRQP